jgi:plastocyanin
MRNILILAVVLASLALAGAAGAKTVTVSITKNGYVPSSTTIAPGDVVQFTNADTVAHQIVFKTTTGVTCTPVGLVLQVAQSGSCTFATAGSYTYNDPNVKGNTFRGSVTVTAPPETVSLAGAPQALAYGGKVTLTGALSTHTVGASIDVMAQQCGQAAATKVATVQTATAGAFTAVVQPFANTTYTAKSKAATSSPVAVKVKPQLRLARVAAHRYSIRVVAAETMAGKYSAFQRYNAALSRWVTLKQVVLRASSTAAAPAVASSATFRSAVKAGLKVRALITQAQVGTCYLAGVSNAVRS